MKQCIVFFLLFFSVSVYAQNISVKLFTALPQDMTARIEQRKDQNGNIAALIRVKTNHEGFIFEGGFMGIVDTKQEDGEVFVWVPSHSKRLTIIHPEFGILKDYQYPVEIEEGMTYELLLSIRTVSCSPPRPHTNENSSERSRNVTVYDKEGNPYTTGLLITTTNRAWIRIQKGLGDYEQYPLKDADKHEYTYMTTGNSKIEPLYVK